MIKHTSYLQEVRINNLQKINRLLPLLMFILLSTVFSTESISQALSCHGQLNVSLNDDCEFEVTPEVLSTVPLDAACTYTVMLTAKKAIAGNTVDYTNLGQLITAKLIDNCTSNTCWGTILVEDKIAPSIDCGTPVNISCLEMDDYLPIVTDCDTAAFAVQIGQTITLGECDTGNDIIKTIARTYVGEDASGNQSLPCTQTINIIRINTDNFVNPPDFIDGNSLVCGSDYPLDSLGHPSPDTTGIPLLAFPSLAMPDTLIPLYPTINDVCKARIEYKDFVIGKDGCLTKIMREWSYVDACSSYDQIFVHTQTIWIRDTEAPKLVVSHPITTIGTPLPGRQSAHGWGVGNSNCEFAVNIPPINGTDNCSGIVRHEVYIDGNLVLTTNGGIVNLPADTFQLEYVGFDGCGTPGADTTQLIVLDAVAPVAVCDRHSVIGLTTDGTVEVQAFVFDDGSFDDCGLEKMEIARMGNKFDLCDTLDIDFGPTVTFCCNDIGLDNMLAFRVYDFSGRYNTCMVSVEIQDKTGPNVDCPGPVTVNCDHPIDLNNLAGEFGSASANNQCETTLTELAPDIDLDSCNKGTITRKWSVSDVGGTDDCIQIITVDNPFDFSFDNLDSLLIRPANIDTSGACGLDLLPDNLPEGSQRPILLGSTCDLLGASYVDEIFAFDSGDGACQKILRNWTIINWCVHPDSVNRLSIAQIIKVNNTEGPEVTLGDNPDEICTFDNDCEDGPITLTASAVDDCSKNLRAIFYLDAFNDGIIDDTLYHAGVSNLASGSSGIEVNGHTTTLTISQTYPIGTHRGIFTFIDECNNVSSKDHVFTIKNCKAPTCALIDGLRISLQVMDTDGDGTPDNEMACIWASDFDASSVSACGGELEYYFDEDKTMPERCFTCCEEGNNRVRVYIFDEFGNHTYCTTNVVVDDHNDVNFCRLTASCPDAEVNAAGCGNVIDPDVLGRPSIGDGCTCPDLRMPFNDVESTNADGCTVITRTWDVSCDGEFVDNCVQTITLINDNAPQLVDCPGHITMNIGGSAACEAFVNIRQPSVNPGCSDNVVVTHNSQFADMQGMNASGTYPVGTTSVTYTATNGCNVSSTCTLTVIVRDNNPPVCNPRDITVTIRDDGEVTVGPRQLDNGSDDSCGDVFVAGTNMTFDCDDAGTTQPVTYFIEDESGNRIECRANVTINDISEPECNTMNRTVSLGADGTATVNTRSLYNGGSGICNNFDIGGTTLTFDCDDAGTTQNVTYSIITATETITCSGTVTIQDIDRPECDARNITVSLGTNGQVVVDPTTLHQGGNTGGVCGDIDITGTPVTFDCCDAGTTQTVTYIINGTINCDARVTIRQEAAPVCNSNDVTVTLGANGTISVNPQSLYDGNGGLCFNVGGENNVVFDCDDAGTTRSVEYTLVPSCSDDQIVSCTANVTINPEGQPQCNAEDITVSLGANGTVTVDPTTLQTGGGSGVCGNGGDVTGTPVTYDCCDAGQTRTITYMIDGTLTCSATVTIDPEAAPVCESQDITVSINANGFVNVNTATLYTGDGGTCFSVEGNTLRFECEDGGTTQTGTYTLVSTCDGAELDCEASIVINAVDDIMITCPDDLTVDCGADVSDLSIFGTATAAEGCGGGAITPTESVSSNLGACNMGVITRTFTATDSNGGEASCRQIITVSGPSNPVTEADITWPMSPFAVAGCDGVAPDDGRPIVDTSNAECSSITMASVDSRLVINANTSCEGNIVRTWTVIDSCQLDGAGGGIFTFEQVFEFTDNVDPVLNLPANVTVTAAGNDCEAAVTLALATATDDCDTNPVITNDSPFADTNGADISGTYPVGTHVVNVTATDRCGNSVTSSITITVRGSAAGFSFECKKKIISIDDNQQAIFHIDSIVCLTQACEGAYTASFSRTDMNVSTIVFGCDDLGTKDGFMSYVYLNGVLFDSCTTFQIVNDRFGNCSSPLNQSDISGFIRTESGQGLSAARIELDGSEFPVSTTNEDGFYAFPPVVNGGSYTIIPEKNDDPLNGVSTLDIIMIQKHILGLEILDSPYKLIAADINNSKSVSVADIAELRKLILGIYDELPANTSWKTIDADYEFNNTSNPFETILPESYDITNLESDMDVDFIGVKVGDVNQSASPVEAISSEVRSNNNLRFIVTATQNANGYTAYEFRASNYDNIEGFQFTLEIDELVSYVGVESGSLNVERDNVGLRYESKGFISVSYNELEARSADDKEVLFTLILDQKTANSLPMRINSSITSAEAYGSDIFGIELETESNDLQRITELGQNNPNPWTSDTKIEFTLPESMNASITVYDIGGRILYRVNQQFKKGANTISLEKDDLAGYSGVAFYELISKDIKLTKSMIVIE